MKGIEVVFEPNVEKDYQAFTFEELGVTLEEWENLNEDDKNDLIYECAMDNINSVVTSIEKY